MLVALGRHRLRYRHDGTGDRDTGRDEDALLIVDDPVEDRHALEPPGGHRRPDRLFEHSVVDDGRARGNCGRSCGENGRRLGWADEARGLRAVRLAGCRPPEHDARANRLLNILMDGLRPAPSTAHLPPTKPPRESLPVNRIRKSVSALSGHNCAGFTTAGQPV